MEAGEYGLTRGTCFVARCLEVVAVAGLMWVSWCVFGGVDFFVFFFSIFFLFERTRPAAEAALPNYLSTSNEPKPTERNDRGRFFSLGQKSLFTMRQGRESEATEAIFCL